MVAKRSFFATAMLVGALLGSAFWAGQNALFPARYAKNADAIYQIETAEAVLETEVDTTVSETIPEPTPKDVEVPAEEPVREPLGAVEQSVAFSLTLTDPDGLPIEGATVLIGELEGCTDAKGKLSMEIPAEDCTLTVSADGFASYATELMLEGETQWEMFVRMSFTTEIRELLNSAPLHPYVTNIDGLNQYIDELFETLFEPGMDTYDKVKACYDWVIHHMYYRYPVHKGSGFWACGYQALQEGYGTCYDYSAAFTAMMRRIGLNCYIVEGATSAYGGGWTGHWWPIIELNGSYYVFDPQVEDSIADRTSDKKIQYLRFCLLEPNVKYTYNLASRAYNINSFERYLQSNGYYLEEPEA